MGRMETVAGYRMMDWEHNKDCREHGMRDYINEIKTVKRND
jgi:hypothetical protein